MYLPIEEDETTHVISLEQVVDPLVHLLPNIHEKVVQAKLNCKHPLGGLLCDESASIYLYSTRWEPTDECLYFVLHDHHQQTLKLWSLYLRLLFIALDRLLSTPSNFYQEMELGFVDNYLNGKVFIYLEFTSCSLSIALSKSKQSPDQTRKRTILNLNESGVTDESVQILTQILALNNCSIERLTLYRNPITNRSVEYRVVMLKTNTKLKYLGLDLKSKNKKRMKQLINQLVKNRKRSTSEVLFRSFGTAIKYLLCN